MPYLPFIQGIVNHPAFINLMSNQSQTHYCAIHNRAFIRACRDCETKTASEDSKLNDIKEVIRTYLEQPDTGELPLDTIVRICFRFHSVRTYMQDNSQDTISENLARYRVTGVIKTAIGEYIDGLLQSHIKDAKL